MDTLETLLAIEAVRSLKARYCIAVDLKDAALLASLLAEDVVADFSGALTVPGGQTPVPARLRDPVRGRQTLVDLILKAVEPQVTVHHCSLGDITIVSRDAARAVWPVVDRLRRPKGDSASDFVGYGFYYETYVRTSDGWRIATIAMSRLRIDEAATPA